MRTKSCPKSGNSELRSRRSSRRQQHRQSGTGQGVALSTPTSLTDPAQGQRAPTTSTQVVACAQVSQRGRSSAHQPTRALSPSRGFPATDITPLEYLQRVSCCFNIAARMVVDGRFKVLTMTWDRTNLQGSYRRLAAYPRHTRNTFEEHRLFRVSLTLNMCGKPNVLPP